MVQYFVLCKKKKKKKRHQASRKRGKNMSQWDKDYIALCKRILSEGKEVENRTGINTIKVPSHHFHLDLGEEFPVLTTKQLFFKQAIVEMLWIYQAQSNDVRWLQERGCHIWDE